MKHVPGGVSGTPRAVDNTQVWVLILCVRYQGSRMRNTKTEYVSCPSCGRTLFDLQEVTEEIRQETGHLPGTDTPARARPTFFLQADLSNTRC